MIPMNASMSTLFGAGSADCHGKSALLDQRSHANHVHEIITPLGVDALSRRLDVLIYMEEIGWIVLLLDGDKALIIIAIG